MNRVRLGQNAFDHWIVLDAADESKAWSGSRFVPITDEGFSAVMCTTQISTRENTRLNTRGVLLQRGR
jgi:hypothetical protein